MVNNAFVGKPRAKVNNTVSNSFLIEESVRPYLYWPGSADLVELLREEESIFGPHDS